MNSATLLRRQSTNQGTPGTLSFGTQVVCTMELPWRENARRLSCIPSGTYLVRWQRSPRLGMCYHLIDVPGRSSILIHAANLAGDILLGFDTELQGCIAPCSKLGFLRNKAGSMQLAGLISRPALLKLEDWGGKADFLLTIESQE